MTLLLLRFVVMTALLLSGYHAIAQNIIHRGVEPAQAILDITLQENTLTIYMTIPNTASRTLYSRTKQSATSASLAKARTLWQLPQEAQCTLNNHRFFLKESNSYSTYGFTDFNCLYPDAITSIKPNLHQVLPDIKQLNIWVTTDHWQSKQSIQIPEGIIRIKPDF